METVTAIKLSKHVGWMSVSLIRQAIGKWWITLTLIHPTIDAKFVNLMAVMEAVGTPLSNFTHF